MPLCLVGLAGGSSTYRPFRSTEMTSGWPALDLMASRTWEKVRVGIRSTATIVSPAFRPTCAAGVPGSTASTRREAADGIPIM